MKIQKWWRKIKKLEYKPIIMITQRRTNTPKEDFHFQKKMPTEAAFPTQNLNDSVFEKVTKIYLQLIINTKIFEIFKKRFATNTPATSLKGNLVIDLSKLQNRSSSLHETLNSESQAAFYSGVPHDRSRSEFDVFQLSLSQNIGQLPLFSKQMPLSGQDVTRKKKLRKINMEKFFELGKMINQLTNIEGQVYNFTGNTNSALDIYSNREILNKSDRERFESIQENEEELFDEDEAKSNRTYRLPVYAKKSAINNQNNFIVDLINEKKNYRNYVQEVEIEAHKKMQEKRENVGIINKKPIKTNDQRFFQKIFGTMTLGCLRAVDKAYYDRTLAEKSQNKVQAVQKYKENKEFTGQQVNYYREERLREVKKIRERERLQLTIAKRRLDLDRIQNRELVQENKSKSKDVNDDRRKDVYLAVDFNKQHLSVSKALQKHEFNINNEHKLKRNSSFVEKQRATTEEQQEIVRKYLQQRNMLKISQTIADRQKIDSKVLQDANDRLLSAKKRVSRLKATTNASTKFYAIHNRSKTSDHTISSVDIPSALFNTNGKNTNNELLRVTVLHTAAMANVTPTKTHGTPLNVVASDKIMIVNDDM